MNKHASNTIIAITWLETTIRCDPESLKRFIIVWNTPLSFFLNTSISSILVLSGKEIILSRNKLLWAHWRKDIDYWFTEEITTKYWNAGDTKFPPAQTFPPLSVPKLNGISVRLRGLYWYYLFCRFGRLHGSQFGKHTCNCQQCCDI